MRVVIIPNLDDLTKAFRSLIFSSSPGSSLFLALYLRVGLGLVRKGALDSWWGPDVVCLERRPREGWGRWWREGAPVVWSSRPDAELFHGFWMMCILEMVDEGMDR